MSQEDQDALAAQEAVNALRAADSRFAEFYQGAQEFELSPDEVLDQWSELAPDDTKDDGGAQ